VQPRGTYRVDPQPIRIRFAEPVESGAYGAARVDDLLEAVRDRMLELMPEATG
jgi:hypothetical protein